MSDASQTLNRAATTALVVGSMLGAGIFLAPPLVAQATQGPLAFFAIWLVGGLCALAGALCYAELTAMFHRSGGEYSFLQAAYGSPLAFAVGWVQVLAIFPGSIASIALALSSFPLPVALGLPVGTTFEASISIGIAAAICLAVALINALGLRIAGRLQAIVTYLPLLILSIACGWVLWFARAAIPAEVTHVSAPTVGIGLAFEAVYFAYSGWNAASYVAGEVKSPNRTLPLAFAMGTGIVTALYLWLCFGFMQVLGMQQLRASGEVGSAIAVQIFGERGGQAFAIMMIFALLASVNGTTMAGARIAAAMADDSPAWSGFSKRTKRHAPILALALQTGLTCLYLLWGAKLDALISWTSSAMLLVGSLAVVALPVLRYSRKGSNLARPFRLRAAWLMVLIYLGSAGAAYVVLLLRGQWQSYVPPVFLLAIWLAGKWRLRKAALAVADLGTRNA